MSNWDWETGKTLNEARIKKEQPRRIYKPNKTTSSSCVENTTVWVFPEITFRDARIGNEHGTAAGGCLQKNTEKITEKFSTLDCTDSVIIRRGLQNHTEQSVDRKFPWSKHMYREKQIKKKRKKKK